MRSPHLGVSPAEMTWKAGVDILSFGGTKNGCIAAEALVFFDPAKARDAPYLRKRAGQLFSKSRFIAAQFDAYFRDGLWLELARHANAMADRLRERNHPPRRERARRWPTEGNEVFAVLPRTDADRLRKAGRGVPRLGAAARLARRARGGRDHGAARRVLRHAAAGRRRVPGRARTLKRKRPGRAGAP